MGSANFATGSNPNHGVDHGPGYQHHTSSNNAPRSYPSSSTAEPQPPRLEGDNPASAYPGRGSGS